MRPHDDDQVDSLDALRWQHAYVTEAGSPTAALVLEAAIEDVAAGGILADVLPRQTRFGDLPGLRVMAAIHRLALDRRAPAVALFLPTLGGRPPATEGERATFRRAVRSALADQTPVVVDSLARTPQTNETGRAALLRCALSRETAGLPVRLREIGASAGLNLRADALPGQPALEAGPLPVVLDRIGCDLDPVDIGQPEGRALLGSYIWVDDVERFERLAHAMSVAERVPATVLRMDAVAFCSGLEVAAGTTTVLWHSAMWVYLSDDVRSAVDAAIEAVGAGARPGAPFVRVSWEWESSGTELESFALVVRRWEGGPADGIPRVLARGMSHGSRVRLTAEG